jgi:hypothetical protein
MNSVQNEPTTRRWLKILPWVAGLLVVILVVWGVKIAWEREDKEPKLPTLQTAAPAAAPKPAPEPYLDITAKVIDDETGKPVEKFALQGGMKKDGKITWGFWMQSPGNYTGGVLTHRFSGKIGEEQVMRVIADGYLPEPIQVVMGQPAIDDMVVRLSRGGTLRGKVLDFDGKPSAGATLYLAGAAQTVSLRDGKPEYFGGSKTTTDEKGQFRLRGIPKETSTVFVVAQSVRPWPVEVKSVEEPIEVKLPEPGKLHVKYDIEGATAVGAIHLHIKSWEMPAFKGVDSMDRPIVNNGSEIVIDHLAPGTYDLARHVQAGNHGLFADRTTVTIESGKTAEAAFVRKEGARVSGKITGIAEDEKIESAMALVHGAELPAGERQMFAPVFDAVTVKDGVFKTSKLAPGIYTIHVQVYKPLTPAQMRMSGIQMPDYEGGAKVTVPAGGEGPQIVIEMKSTAKPAAPADTGTKETGGLDSTRRRL